MKNIAIFKKYRDYIFFTTKIQLFSRYSNMYLGIMWSFVDPLLFMGIYSFIYLILFNFSAQYYLSFLLTGLIIWRWMSASLIQGTASISSKIGMSEQVAVPKQIFSLVDLLMETLLSGIAFVLIFLMMLYEGVPFTWHIVEIITISIIVFVFLFGGTLIMSHFGAFIADLRPALNYSLRFVFYLSPIFYERARLPSELGMLYKFNPVAIIIDGYREALIYGSSPDYLSLLVILLIGFLLIFIGLGLINKYDKEYCKIK